MGVFDGSDLRVTVRRRGDEEGDEGQYFPDNAREFVAALREDSDVLGVETHTVHYMVGDPVYDLCFGSMYAEDDEEDEDA